MNLQQSGLVKASFFDETSYDKYVFWKTPTEKSMSRAKIMEGILFQRCKDNWKPSYFILYEDRLASYKEEDTQGEDEQSFCLIMNVRLDAVSNVMENGTDQQKEELHGFKLTHNQQIYELYAKSKEEQERWLEALTKFCVFTDYKQHYENVRDIGQGRFGCVHLGKRKGDGAEFAVKTFSKQQLSSEAKAQASLINEINVMRQLDHESIIKFYKAYEGEYNIYLVLELLKGGELFDRIMEKRKYNEHDACILLKKLLDALAHMHSKGIMHRDLKPENLILKDTENDSDVKIADFGLAQVVKAENYLYRRCGTPGYVAPEILNDQPYDERVDVFSAGLILYILLTGSSPFYAEQQDEVVWKNATCDISFDLRGHRISPAAIDLMKRMLVKDPKQRLSSSDALQHEWIISGGTFLSPKSNNPIYLQPAQENIKKKQHPHGHGQKQNTEKDPLEKAGHAPSPLITGKVDQIPDSQCQVIFNSPEMSIGAALANRQKQANFNKNTTRGGNNMNQQDQQFMNQNNFNPMNRNMKNQQQQYAMMNQVRPGDMPPEMIMQTTPKTAPIQPKHLQDGQKTNVHHNFMKYLTGPSPQMQAQPGKMAGPQDHQQYFQQQKQAAQFQQFQQFQQQQFQAQYQPYQNQQYFQQFAQPSNLQQMYYQQAQPQPQYNQQQQFQPQMQYPPQHQYQPQPQNQAQHPQQQNTSKAKNVSKHLKQLQ